MPAKTAERALCFPTPPEPFELPHPPSLAASLIQRFLVESTALRASDIPADAFSAARRRILVIDDEVDIRESLELLLSAEDYLVDLAENAAAGLLKFEAGAYDLILLDLMMPDRSGLEVLADIRQRDRETPVFMMTAFGSVEVAVRALKGGANDYFPK